MTEKKSFQEKELTLNLSNTGLTLGLTLLLALTGAACSSASKKQEVTAEAAAKPAASVTPATVDVTTAAAIKRGLQRDVQVVGSLAADDEVVVSAQVAGELSQLNVDFGGFVTQGQVIAVIDQRDAKLKVEQAEATLKQTLARLGMKEGDRFDPQQAADVRVAKTALDWARMDLDRNTKLIENGDIARSVFDQATINHNAAQARYQAALDAVNQQLALAEQQRAALALAKKAITDTVVRSPITGAVKEKLAAKGSYLAVGGKIASLVKINPLRLRADIPESYAAAVRKGQTMTLNVEAFPGRSFTGRVVRIGASLNEQTRALTVEAEVGNAGNLLRPGMFAKSQLITAKDAPAVMIPARAIVTVAGLTKVYVIENGKAVERIVKTGTTDGDLIEIVEGISEGESVATSNTDKLQQGTAVTAGK
ncbi:MAG TPA: efflux RND transporter periplasmic adaptor subunit [Blastocatellia bacterium]|nr:efflux RND transporter periplasmic adaptor subunit [Blastocatellia bacterium]HMX29369.1 efflux RND transporter periplasmic adaptor subunit [Blastocatellia bacterium]HMZ22270.1 efflux RND transporter periplasmic adaptor subunit [Blastocatellia bacterium]HNG30345.1 efflux RND transporter periplasmic adaptor subunit [Blastocatellia bacterium]